MTSVNLNSNIKIIPNDNTNTKPKRLIILKNTAKITAKIKALTLQENNKQPEETPIQTPIQELTSHIQTLKINDSDECDFTKNNVILSKAQMKAQEKAEKDAKKAQEKAEKDAKKAQEKAEKDAKKAQEKAEKNGKRKNVTIKTEIKTEMKTDRKTKEERPPTLVDAPIELAGFDKILLEHTKKVKLLNGDGIISKKMRELIKEREELEATDYDYPHTSVDIREKMDCSFKCYWCKTLKQNQMPDFYCQWCRVPMCYSCSLIDNRHIFMCEDGEICEFCYLSRPNECEKNGCNVALNTEDKICNWCSSSYKKRRMV